MLEQNTAQFYESMEILYPSNSEESEFDLRWDEDFCKAALNLRQIRDKRKNLDKEEQEVREYLIKLSNGRNCKGMGLTISKVNKKGNVNWANIPELKGVDLEQHRGPSTETWRFT